MGKRSNFERRERDFYTTPQHAVLPLLRFIPKGMPYFEPCAGDGRLIKHLDKWARCIGASDVYPRGDGICQQDASTFPDREVWPAKKFLFITNPPWPQKIGEPTISIALNLSGLAPTWLLLSADFAHNKYFRESGLYDRCQKIVSVGRVSWEGNGIKGKDNCAWYLFDAKHQTQAEFYARAA